MTVHTVAQAGWRGVKWGATTQLDNPPMRAGEYAKMGNYRHCKWESAFLQTYAINANMTESAKAAGIGRGTAYARMKNFPEFKKLVDAAEEEAIDGIEKAAMETAKQGEPSMQRWILSRRRFGKWNDPAKRIELSGPGGGAIQTDGNLNLSALSNEELADILGDDGKDEGYGGRR